jgi:hypothetical protein
VVCKATVSLESPYRTKESILLETARKHFYKHKLFENLAVSVEAQPEHRIKTWPVAMELKRDTEIAAKDCGQTA